MVVDPLEHKIIDFHPSHKALPSNHQTIHRTPPTHPPPPPARHPRPPPTQHHPRPGRSKLRQPLNVDLNSLYGASIHERDSSSIRVFFQNVKGLTYTTTGEEYAYYLSCTSSLGADIIGMAETNSAWLHSHLRQSLQQYHRHKVNFSSPLPEIDPIPDTETFQAGGTLTMALNSLVPMAFGASPQDPTGFGRWSSLSFQGQGEHFLTILSAYRVCKGSIQSSPIGSAFSREYEYHRGKGIKTPQPRKLILQDLTHALQHEQSKGHAILIMMDSNGSLDDDTDLQKFISECDLTDLHESDHIFGCPQVHLCITSSGTLAYTEGPQSDHRGLFVDLDLQQLLHRTTTPPALSTASSRFLKTGNPEAVATYHAAILAYYADHIMIQLLEKLVSTKDDISISSHRTHLEKWDSDQGHAMKNAEDLLKRPTKPYEWSPKLRNDGLLYQYWRLRLRKKTLVRLPSNPPTHGNKPKHKILRSSSPFSIVHFPYQRFIANSNSPRRTSPQAKANPQTCVTVATMIYLPRTPTIRTPPHKRNPNAGPR